MSLIVDDYSARIVQPQYSHSGDIVGMYEQTIITKETFVKCYNKWIKGNEEAADDQQAEIH